LIIHGSFLIFLLGTLFAVISGATFDVYKFIFGYAIVSTAILAVSYSNNYFDATTDKYSTQTAFSGGSKILVEHPELLRLTKWIAIGLFGLSIILGFLFMVVFSYPITFLVLVILGNILGWFYTAPPIKLAYRGLGELSTMIGVGFLIPGIGYFIVMGQIDSSFVVLAIPFLMYGFAFSINLEIPDINTDLRGNKKTLIVRKGQRFGFVFTILLLSLATLSFLVIAQLRLIPGAINFWLITLLSLIPLSFTIRNLVKYNTDQTADIKLVTSNVTSMFFLIIIINGYFLFLIFS
jgi:1,4-dihydroxy-2-naphthoate octaprenyltransferase